jgi:hypothetical protein
LGMGRIRSFLLNMASESHNSIISYHEMVKDKDVPTLGNNENSQYTSTDLEEYNGLNIDWNSFNQQFMAAQLSKTMIYSSEVFNKFSKRLDEIYDKVSSEKK